MDQQLRGTSIVNRATKDGKVISTICLRYEWPMQISHNFPHSGQNGIYIFVFMHMYVFVFWYYCFLILLRERKSITEVILLVLSRCLRQIHATV